MPRLGPEALKEHGHHGLAILPQGIAPAGQAPVIDQRPLAQGIDPDHLADGHVPPQLPPLLALEDDLPQELIIGPVVVQQVLVPPGDELGGVQGKGRIRTSIEKLFG